MLRDLSLSIFALFFAAGCQDYLFQMVEPSRVTEATRNIVIEPSPADIVFIVDDSGSMADEQDKLAASFDRFIRVIAQEQDPDLYRIAIVTTDLDTDRPERTGTQDFEFGPLPYKHFQRRVLRSTCTDIAPPIQHACFRGPMIIPGRMSPEEAIASFKETVRVGSCGSGAEQGLNAMVRAIEQAKDGECNESFLRADANLVVVVVSDEDDTQIAVPPFAVAAIVEQLAALKPLEKMRFAAIVGSADGAAAACRIAGAATSATCGSICSMMPPADGSHAACSLNSDCPSGQTCQGVPDLPRFCENALLEDWSSCASCSFYQTDDCCSAVAGYRYVDFARELERRVTALDPNLKATGCRPTPDGAIACLVDSICQENFGDTLASVASELVIPFIFTLDPPAVNGEGVKVVFRGPSGDIVLPKAEFEVSPDGRQLKLIGRKPMRGDTVQIFFVIDK